MYSAHLQSVFVCKRTYNLLIAFLFFAVVAEPVAALVLRPAAAPVVEEAFLDAAGEDVEDDDEDEAEEEPAFGFPLLVA